MGFLSFSFENSFATKESDPVKGRSLSLMNKRLGIFGDLLSRNATAQDGGNIFKDIAKTINTQIFGALENAIVFDRKFGTIKKNAQTGGDMFQELRDALRDKESSLKQSSLYITHFSVRGSSLVAVVRNNMGQPSETTILNLATYFQAMDESTIKEKLENNPDIFTSTYGPERQMGEIIRQTDTATLEKVGVDADCLTFDGVQSHNGTRMARFMWVGIPNKKDRLRDPEQPEMDPFPYDYNFVLVSQEFLRTKIDYMKKRGLACRQAEIALAQLESHGAK